MHASSFRLSLPMFDVWLNPFFRNFAVFQRLKIACCLFIQVAFKTFVARNLFQIGICPNYWLLSTKLESRIYYRVLLDYSHLLVISINFFQYWDMLIYILRAFSFTVHCLIDCFLTPWISFFRRTLCNLNA
jgi:hypothetical protein